MKNNNSKQTVLMLVGVAILVIAVVGVSFAFFNYSKEGQYSNVVTTGSVFFNFTEGDVILLENQFPIPDETGEAFNKDKGAKDVLSFEITGWDTSSKGIDYTIYGVKGDIPTKKDGEYQEVNRLSDSDIKIQLKVTDAASTTITNDYQTSKTVKEGLVNGETLGTTTADGCKIATGQIPGETSEDDKKTVKFELRMWISDEKVEVVGDEEVETDRLKPEFADKNVYGETAYADMFYSFKLLIDAKTTKGA